MSLWKERRIMENYTFEDMWVDLKNGYQIYYTYVRNRYVLFKTAKNCYTQKLITDNPKNPQPRMTMLTLKRVKEMFPHMEDIEYKVRNGIDFNINKHKICYNISILKRRINMYTEFGIKKDLLELAKEVENEIKPQFEKIENIKELNSLKVLNAFQKSRLSEMHLH